MHVAIATLTSGIGGGLSEKTYACVYQKNWVPHTNRCHAVPRNSAIGEHRDSFPIAFAVRLHSK